MGLFSLKNEIKFMKSPLVKITLFIALIIFISAPFVARAIDVTIPNPLQADTFAELINLIIKFVFNLALWIAVIMFLIAGFVYITANGEPAKIKQAKDIILWTSVGLIVVISAKGLVALFDSIFRNPPPP
jgi:hypothetical protein